MLPPGVSAASSRGIVNHIILHEDAGYWKIKMDTTRNNTKEIIAYLETKFNGDADHDVEVIQEYCRSLDRTKDNLDIVMALGRYCAEKYPNAKAIQNAKKIEEAFDVFQKKLQSAQELLKEKKLEEAVVAFDELIGENTPVESDEKHYYSFGHPFEETLCKMYFNDDKPIERISGLPMALYYQKAAALFDLKRYDEAKATYEHCTKLNPVDVRTWLELAQIAKAEENYDEVRNILKKIHPFIYTRHFLARFYREQAFLAVIDEKYQLAVALTYISMDYEDSAPARAQLNALAKHRGVDLSKPSVEQVKSMLSEAGIPVGPAPQVYELAMNIGMSMKKSYPQIARMAFAIAYDITHYEPLLKELQ